MTIRFTPDNWKQLWTPKQVVLLERYAEMFSKEFMLYKFDVEFLMPKEKGHAGYVGMAIKPSKNKKETTRMGFGWYLNDVPFWPKGYLEAHCALSIKEYQACVNGTWNFRCFSERDVLDYMNKTEDPLS